MPKRSGPSSSRGNNRKKPRAIAVPTQPMLVPTGTGPQRDIRLIMERVFAQSKSSGNSNDNVYWNSGQDANFLRLCIQEPSLVTSIFIIHGIYVVPLTFLIKFRAKLSLVQVFCKKFPHAVKTALHTMSPLQVACAKPDVMPGIVPLLAKSYPQAAAGSGMWLLEKRTREFSKSSLALLLNNFDPSDNDSNAENLENIKAVFGAVKTRGLLETEEEQNRLFQWLIDSDDDCYKCQDLIQFVVEQCPKISKVELLANDYSPFPEHALPGTSSRLLLVTPQLKELDLDIDLEFEDLGTWQNFMRALGNASHMQALKLWIMDWPEDEDQRELFAAALFDALGSIPNLKKIFLRGCYDIRIDDDSGGLGEVLASILRRNTIEKMFVTEFEPEPKHEPILAALKDNTSLKCLGIESCYDTEEKQKALLVLLTEKNTSLEHVINFDDSPTSTMDQITFLCLLNSLGRDMARDPFTPLAVFVALVEEAVEADNMYGPEDVMAEAGLGLDFIYGLLRECPSIWCA